MSHVEPERGGRSHETEYSDPAIKYSKCPTCGFATIYKGQAPAQDAPRIVDEAIPIMDRARRSLKRFAARYAEAPHAKEAAKEARLIVEAINDWKLRL